MRWCFRFVCRRTDQVGRGRRFALRRRCRWASLFRGSRFGNDRKRPNGEKSPADSWGSRRSAGVPGLLIKIQWDPITEVLIDGRPLLFIGVKLGWSRDSTWRRGLLFCHRARFGCFHDVDRAARCSDGRCRLRRCSRVISSMAGCGHQNKLYTRFCRF